MKKKKKERFFKKKKIQKLTKFLTQHGTWQRDTHALPYFRSYFYVT